jgi:tetratricopeptide (TPR) repeat protein
MLDVADPDALIADRLSGDAPFMAAGFLDLSTDVLEDLPVDETPAEPAKVDTVAAPPASDVAATPATEIEEEPETVLDLASMETATAPAAAPVAEVTVPASTGAAGRGARRASGPPPAAMIAEVDLTGILGDLDHLRDADQPADLENVFDDLRSEAEDEDGEFAAQYLKLASTYIDMGMMDDAMTALRTAAQTPSQRFEAASMLGRLHTQRGETALAIEWLEQAAEEPAPNVVEGRALLYDLGVMLEKSGESARALAVFLELQADAGDYRDVPARIDRLARVQSGG